MANDLNKFNQVKDNCDIVEDNAVADMKQCVSNVREAITRGDTESIKKIYDYLNSKASEYADYGYDGYDIVTCSDFAYDAYLCLSGKSTSSAEQLLQQYDYLFNQDSPSYHNSAVNDNVIHSTGVYTGPGA